jgi:hypothetical protein
VAARSLAQRSVVLESEVMSSSVGIHTGYMGRGLAISIESTLAGTSTPQTDNFIAFTWTWTPAVAITQAMPDRCRKQRRACGPPYTLPISFVWRATLAHFVAMLIPKAY